MMNRNGSARYHTGCGRRRAVGIVTSAVAWGFVVSPACGAAAAGKPFPRVQVIPLPADQASFQVDGVERLRYHFGPRNVRPFWFPVIGPAGRPVTRITHPHDPYGHRHHTSVWVAHHRVNGLGFWNNQDGTRIVHQRVERYEDGRESAAMTTLNHWLAADGKLVVTERRTTRYRPLADGEAMIEITLRFIATEAPVTFGKTPFGFLGVRVAKTMSVHDGGGTIRNSGGGVDEKGVFWKSARWVDYSGRVAPDVVNGITLMDHPSNPRYPTYFHVRDDGWMGTSFCLYEPYVLDQGKTLVLRYGLYIHGDRTANEIAAQWDAFAKE